MAIQDNNWLYSLLRYYVDYTFEMAYSDVEYHGTENIPHDGAVIFYPSGADFSDSRVQQLLKAGVLRALKVTAADFLPPLLDEWSQRYNLPYNKVKINGARTRWGSCSAARTINLSCYLMLLPPHLMDYVLLHELTHTREMNHGPKFWALLDSMTGGPGTAKSLRAELRNFSIGF